MREKVILVCSECLSRNYTTTINTESCKRMQLKKYCKQIWVDGVIRTILDVQTALFYGADKVIIARPFIRATFDEEPLQL